MTSTSKSNPSDLGGWLGRKRALLALLRNDRYRRDLLALLALNLRAALGWKLVFSFGIIAALGGWLLFAIAPPPQLAFEILQGVFVLGAVALGAGIYSTEKDQGTFELLWLASGSERALLRLKLGTALLLLIALEIPSTLIVSGLLPETLPVGSAIFHLASGSFFVLAVMALIGTWLPHAWSSGLAGAAILGGIWMAGRGTLSSLYPFVNPIPTPDPAHAFSKGNPAAILFTNRVLLLGFSVILLDVAARRLRKVL